MCMPRDSNSNNKKKETRQGKAVPMHHVESNTCSLFFFLEASQLGAATIFHLSLSLSLSSLFPLFPSSSLFTPPLFLFPWSHPFPQFATSFLLHLSLSLFSSPLLFLHFSPLFSRNPFIFLIFPWNHPSLSCSRMKRNNLIT